MLLVHVGLAREEQDSRFEEADSPVLDPAGSTETDPQDSMLVDPMSVQCKYGRTYGCKLS